MTRNSDSPCYMAQFTSCSAHNGSEKHVALRGNRAGGVLRRQRPQVRILSGAPYFNNLTDRFERVFAIRPSNVRATLFRSRVVPCFSPSIESEIERLGGGA